MKVNAFNIIPLIIAFVFGFIFYSIYLTFNSFKQIDINFNLVKHTYNVIDRLHDLEESLIRAESNARGYYMVGGNETTLKEFDQNIEYIYKDIEETKALVKGNKAQEENVRNLKTSLEQRISLLRLIIEGTNNPSVSLDSITAIYGLASIYNSNIGIMTNNIENYEMDTLSFRQGKTEKSIRHSKRYLMFTAISSLLAASAVFYIIKKDRNTRLKNIEQLKALNDNKNKFFSIISHDLRGPIYATGQLYDLMKYKNIQNGDYQQIFGMMGKSIQKVKNLMEELLEWSRLQLDNLDFKPSVLNLKEISETAIRETESLAGNKNISIFNSISEHHHVLADNYMAITILRNLISNSIKFSLDKSSIYLKAVVKDNFIYITVRDEGVGIDEKTLSHLFQVGKKITTRGTNMEEGTGLGLPLCKEFVEKNGGTIYAESQIGKGSAFTFSLPRAYPNKNKQLL